MVIVTRPFRGSGLCTGDHSGGYVGCDPAPFLGDDTHPIGASLAASLCAGEIFKYVRGMRADVGTFARRIWLDAASLEISSEPSLRQLLFPTNLELLPAVVAGIGAVGNGLLHILYPLADVVVGSLTLLDGDVQGVEETNLNRYVLCGREHIGRQKVLLETTHSQSNRVKIEQLYGDLSKIDSQYVLVRNLGRRLTLH